MHGLIVLAHPSPLSFNAALIGMAAAGCKQAGHQVRVTDLYAEGFEARLDRDDMGGNAPEGYFNVGCEQVRAWRKGTLAADIAAQIEHLRWAELVILQFPLWWYGPPAILKGWMDRVFLPGFSFGRENWSSCWAFRNPRSVEAPVGALLDLPRFRGDTQAPVERATKGRKHAGTRWTGRDRHGRGARPGKGRLEAAG